MELQMYGLKNAQEFLVELPKEAEKQIILVEQQFLHLVEVNAKARAPHFSGQLAESIRVKNGSKKGEFVMVVESPYGWFQEVGFRPTFLPSELPVEGGYRIGDWMQFKGLRGKGFKPSGQPHPFAGPALEWGLNQLPSMLTSAAYNAAEEAKIKSGGVAILEK